MTTCTVNKVDSNITGLSIAEEVCLGQLPTIAADGYLPEWQGLEPNTYSDFGGDLTTVARQPISATRQRKKGTITGQSASGGFNSDLTQNNLTKYMQGFFFANARQKPATKPFNGTPVVLTSIATSDDSFNAASGLNRFLAGHLVKVSKTVQNNGLFLVSSAVAAKIVVGSNLVDETPSATAQLEAVGFQFASGVVSLTSSAAAAVLSISGLAQAVGTYTLSGNVTAADTVTIGTRVYTFVAALTGVANEVLIAGTAANTLVNLAAAINGTTGAGTTYGLGTVAHVQVTAASTATTVVATAVTPGVSSNVIATTESGSNSSWGAATLTGGTGAAGWVELGIVPGEWVFVGGDLTAEAFTYTASTNRQGYARVTSVTSAVLTFDRTTWVPQTDAGTGKTIRVFFGTVIRNEPLAADIVTRSYQIERTLGKDDVGTQAQYLEGAIANEFKLNIPDADKLNCDLNFIALDDSTVTGADGLKNGTRLSSPGESAFNTSLDIYEIRLAVFDPASIDNEPLFAFLQQADISITNNAAPVRALGSLGGIDVSVGNFDTSGSITALFSSVEAIRAIRNNADVGLSVIAARANGGIIFDMPLLGLGGGRLNVTLNSPITLPLTAAGAQNANGYTLLSNWLPYLPTIAMPA